MTLNWDAKEDTVSLQQPSLVKSQVATKREILRQTSRLFDPLGLLSPVTIRAKLLIQDLWRMKYDWDTPLPDDLQVRWHCIVDDLEISAKQRFARPYCREGTSPLTLHVFVDASIQSYGATAYICSEENSTIIMAKSRVAPLKTLTLPKLELMAAVIGARLAKHVRQSINVDHVHLWSDSQIVLYWIQGKKPVKQFVARRVEEIGELTCEARWRYSTDGTKPDFLSRTSRTAFARTIGYFVAWIHANAIILS